MKITVIVCTYNRCRQLAVALESVARSVHPDFASWEILVVDNNSTDQTREVAETFCRRHEGRFRYLFEKRKGKSNALNAGITSAVGDVLAFMDDDVQVEPTWLLNLVEGLRNNEWAGCGGRVLPQQDVPLPKWLPPDAWFAPAPLAIFDRGSERRELHEPPFGTNMAFRKTVFEKYGGFRSDLGPGSNSEIRNEDSEFGRRILAGGERIYYEPSAVVYHSIVPERLNQQYFLTWWFDKGRSGVREDGIPRDTNLLVAGIPLEILSRLTRWAFQWLLSVSPNARFDAKLKVWLNAGTIVECRSLWKASKLQEESA